eukprot:SAG31_NODE_22689_length_520_cov_0.733967_1_plen_61_part_10
MTVPYFGAAAASDAMEAALALDLASKRAEWDKAKLAARRQVQAAKHNSGSQYFSPILPPEQ